MKYFLLIVSLFVLPLSLVAQEARAEIKGRVYVQTNDLEGIAVYNSSANEGTTTDENGRFVIEAKLNDVINFSALQFKDFSIRISERIMDSGSMTAMLVEDVNKLDEVIILPYDLSGSLFVDLNSVRTYNVDMDSIYSGVADQDKYNLSADSQSSVDNAAVDDQLPYMDNGLNIINLAGLILKPFKKKRLERQSKTIPSGTLITRYNAEFLEYYFKIPRARSDEFLIFVEEKGIQANL
ncbi:MAG: carboxypeptidase-like regulatory domain-containing protein, partial [Bacteroidota bacterium]